MVSKGLHTERSNKKRLFNLADEGILRSSGWKQKAFLQRNKIPLGAEQLINQWNNLPEDEIDPLSLQLFRWDLCGTSELHLSIWVLKTGGARGSLAGKLLSRALGVPSACHQMSLEPYRAGLCPALCPFAAAEEHLLTVEAEHGPVSQCCHSPEGSEPPKAQPGTLGWGFPTPAAHQILPPHLWDCTSSASLHSSTTYL